MGAEFKERLRLFFAPVRALSGEQLELLDRHFELLLAWNRQLNLTRITDLDDAVRLHYAESLFLGSLIPGGSLTIADIGSGAGFPGFPIAVLRPDCQVDLIESHQRKAVFLREAIRGAKNVRVVSQRAEDVRTRYDWVVSRAVDREEVLRLPLASNFALLGSEGEIEVPFSPGHFVARCTISS